MRRPSDATKAASQPPAGRFAGGREYELTFNTTAFNSTEKPRPGHLGRVRQGPR